MKFLLVAQTFNWLIKVMINKFKNFYHTCSYKDFKVVEVISLYCSLIGIVGILGSTVLIYWNVNLNIWFTSIFSIILLFCGLLHSQFSPIYEVRMKIHLMDIIRNNDLFLVDGNIVYESVIFSFEREDSFLKIRYSNKGVFYKQFDKMPELLQAKLKLQLYSEDVHLGVHFLSFLLRENSSYNVEDIWDEFKEIQKKIPLNDVINWDFNSHPHMQITGTTGSGKTRLIMTLILFFVRLGADVRIIDPKRSELASFSKIFGQQKVGSTIPFISNLLNQTVIEMNNRYSQYFENDDNPLGSTYSDYHLRPIVIFIDEWVALKAEAQNYDKKLLSEIENNIVSLFVKGRQAGITVIMSSQRLSADSLNSICRENSSVRILLQNVQQESYKMALGVPYNQVPIYNTLPGQGYIMMDGQGWKSPRPYTSPILNFETFNKKYDYFKELKYYYDFHTVGYGDQAS